LGGSQGASSNKKSKHCLDVAKRTQGVGPVEDVKGLLAVLIVLLPAPLFWSLSDQQSSKWIFQGGNMDRKLPWWLGGIVVEEDQMQVHSSLVLMSILCSSMKPAVFYFDCFIEKVGLFLCCQKVSLFSDIIARSDICRVLCTTAPTVHDHLSALSLLSLIHLLLWCVCDLMRRR
jgi:hypothetical protein